VKEAVLIMKIITQQNTLCGEMKELPNSTAGGTQTAGL
jgi:hypothetical protein